MAKNVVKKKATLDAKNGAKYQEPSWDAAIMDAQEMIERKRFEIARLKGAIRVFAERRDSGEPWPSESLVHTT